MADATEVWALWALSSWGQNFWSHLPPGVTENTRMISFALLSFKPIRLSKSRNTLWPTTADDGGWDRSAPPACRWMSAILAAVRLASCLQMTHRVNDGLCVRKHHFVISAFMLNYYWWPTPFVLCLCVRAKVYLACDGGKTNAMECTPVSLGFLWIFVSAVNATPGE